MLSEIGAATNSPKDRKRAVKILKVDGNISPVSLHEETYEISKEEELEVFLFVWIEKRSFLEQLIVLFIVKGSVFPRYYFCFLNSGVYR